MRKIFIVAFCVSFFCQTISAQTMYNGYSNPMPPTPQPASMPQYGFPNAPANGQVKMGATAADIIGQVNANSQQATIDRIMKETAQSEAQKRQEQIQEIENEVNESFKAPDKKYDFSYFQSKDFAEKSQSYRTAFTRLENMLSGKEHLSVKDAYYITETAYGNPYLTKAEYDNTIQKSVKFIKEWIAQNGYDIHNNDAVQLAIQKFMSQKLTVRESTKDKDGDIKFQSTAHLPLFYDFNDYKGEKDFRNYFITKCIATGSGQCNSMPGVYLCLAEGLGVKAYLSFAPLHALIKYADNNGTIRNYEATTDWGINDRWYAEHFFISPQALRSGIYLDTMNSSQIVANQLIDLAFGYMNKFGIIENKFPMECLKAALPYFPKQNNIQAYFLYSMILRSMLIQCMNDNGLRGFADIKKSEKATAIYNELIGNEAYIKKLGYQDMPSTLYDEIIQHQEMKGKVQEDKKITGKEKRNLFIQTTNH